MLEISPVERPVAVPRRTSVHPAILARDFRPLPPCPPCTHGIAARCSGPPISTPIWWNTRHHFPAPQVSPAPRPRSLRTALYAGRSRSCPDHRRQYLRSEIEDTHTHTNTFSLYIPIYTARCNYFSLFCNYSVVPGTTSVRSPDETTRNRTIRAKSPGRDCEISSRGLSLLQTEPAVELRPLT